MISCFLFLCMDFPVFLSKTMISSATFFFFSLVSVMVPSTGCCGSIVFCRGSEVEIRATFLAG